jgi:N-acetylmuramoyl-L-alanine amidase
LLRKYSRWYALAALTVLLAGARGASGQAARTALTLLSKDGRRSITLVAINGQEFVPLDELAPVFQLTVHEEAGALTVACNGRTIVLTPDQPLASVAGRLVSLPAPPLRSGRRWLVPVDFISRALGLVYGQRLDLRTASQLVVVGDLRVPRVTVRDEPLGAAARLVIDATPHTASNVDRQAGRLTVRFDADALDLSIGPVASNRGLVEAVRQVDPTSLEIALGPNAASVRTSTQTVDLASRTVIELAPQVEAVPAPAPPSPAAPSPTSTSPGTPSPAAPTPAPGQPPLMAPEAPSLRTVVIDPGHGGEDTGVRGAGGAMEKDVALAVARRLKQVAESRLGIRVLLTRSDDRNVPIDDRAALANNNKADLFISLHADGALRAATSGASVLYAAFDADAATAAASLGSERLPTLGGGTREIDLVLWDLAQIRHVDESARFADLLEQQFLGRVPMARHPLERAPLRVLESANMPAVLVETGFLSNPAQEKQLTSPAFQSTVAQAIVDAMLKYRDALGTGRHTAAGGTGPVPAGAPR